MQRQGRQWCWHLYDGNFSKASAIVIFNCQFSSEQTFEIFTSVPCSACCYRSAVRAHTHKRTHVHDTHAHIPAVIIHTHTYTHIHATHTRTHIYARTYDDVRTHIHMHTHTVLMYTHTHAHAYMHTICVCMYLIRDVRGTYICQRYIYMCEMSDIYIYEMSEVYIYMSSEMSEVYI